MSLKILDNLFSTNRVIISKAYPKTIQQRIQALYELQAMAEKKDVFIKLEPSKKNIFESSMTIFRKGIDHVSDIPEYAVENNTGDQVYIGWEKNIYQTKVSTKMDEIVKTAKIWLGFGE